MIRRFLIRRFSEVGWPLLTIALVLAGWQLWVTLAHVPLFLMAPASDVLAASFKDWKLLYPDVLATVQETLLGFALSVGVGIPLALLLDASSRLQRAIYPLLVSTQLIPVVALAPLFILWFGFGLLPKVLIVFLFCIFVIVVNSLVGLRSVELEKLYLARSMGANRVRIFFKIKIPSALPNILSGLKIAVTLAVIGSVVGEFVASERGLGHVVILSSSQFDTVTLFVGIVYLVLIGVAAFTAMEIVERLVIPWHLSRRLENLSTL